MERGPAPQDSHEDVDLETVHLPFLPNNPLTIGLFTDLQNAPQLRQQLLSGNADFEYAFVDASSVFSTKHVLAACFRAVNDSINNRLRCRNVHAEIVFALNPNNNIADAFRNFGISDSTTSLIAIKVGNSAKPVEHLTATANHLKTNVHGKILPFKDGTLQPLSDVSKLKKLYKLTLSSAGIKPGKGKRRGPLNGTGGAEPAGFQSDESPTLESQRDERAEMEAVILGIMAMKGS